MARAEEKFTVRRKVGIACLCAWVLGAAVQAEEAGDAARRFWPQWRGPLRTGVAPEADPPLEWSERRHIRWKVEIPGKGSASPIVWGDRVFVLTAIPSGAEQASPAGFFDRLVTRVTGGIAPTHVQRFTIIAFSRLDGKILWQQTARAELPHEGTQANGSWASASAVTDGEQVCAFFGSRGLYCYDFDGTLRWERDLGDMQIRLGFGEGASPALFADRIIVNWDHQGQSFITALDKKTGRDLWRVNRDEATSWATPLIVEHDGRVQVITSATSRVRSYDVQNGRLLWEGDGVTQNAIPTPVADDERVYLTSGYLGSRLMAVRLSAATDDIDRAGAIAWEVDRDTPYVPSPLLHQGVLYVLKSNSGVLTAYDAQSGRKLYGPQRVPGARNVYASPVAAGDRMYVTSREGTTVVLRPGPTFEVLATNVLEDEIDASPALVDGEIYLRGSRYLYCIAVD